MPTPDELVEWNAWWHVHASETLKLADDLGKDFGLSREEALQVMTYIWAAALGQTLLDGLRVDVVVKHIWGTDEDEGEEWKKP